MREIRLSGSVRGVWSDSYPYREPILPVQSTAPFGMLAGTNTSGPQIQQGRPGRDGLRLREEPAQSGPDFYSGIVDVRRREAAPLPLRRIARIPIALPTTSLCAVGHRISIRFGTVRQG